MRLLHWIERNATSLAVWLAAATFVALLFLGVAEHPMPIASAENDGFLHKAEEVCSGHLPRDPHRPLLYVLLVAGVGKLLGGNCFLAGKIVSSLAVGLAVLTTAFLGRALWGRSTGLVAAVLLACHPLMWENGVQVATDATFASLLLLATYLGVRAARRPTAWNAALAGLCTALGYTTRYTAIVLVPPMLLATCFGVPRGRRLRQVGSFVAALVVGLVPHCILTRQVFGRPFYDETWRSLAFRHYGSGDWGFLEQNPFRGTADVLLHDPGRIVRNTGNELVAFWERLPNLLLGGWDPAALWLSLLVVLAAVASWWRRPIATLVVLCTVVGYVLMVAMTFFTWERIMLPALPLLLLLFAWGLVHLPSAPFPGRRLGPVRFFVASLACAFGVLTIASTLPVHLTQFRDSHPIREVEVAKGLVKDHGRDISLVCSYRAMDHQVPCRCFVAVLSDDAATTYRAITDAAMAADAGYVVMGRASLYEARFRPLRAAAPPDHLKCIENDPDVLVYRVDMLPLEQIAKGPLRVQAGGDGSFEIVLELREDAPEPASVLVALSGPAGVSAEVPLAPAAGWAFSAKLQIPPGVTGTFVLCARALTRSGSLYRGEPIRWTMP